MVVLLHSSQKRRPLPVQKLVGTQGRCTGNAIQIRTEPLARVAYSSMRLISRSPFATALDRDAQP
jgi:hypothetical protein